MVMNQYQNIKHGQENGKIMVHTGLKSWFRSWLWKIQQWTTSCNLAPASDGVDVLGAATLLCARPQDKYSW